MRKRFVLLIFIALLLYVVALPSAGARLMIRPGQQMIERSDLIIDATVTGSKTVKDESGNKKVYEFTADRILKYSDVVPRIKVVESCYQKVPSPGSRVLLFLVKDPTKYPHANYAFTADVNNIGIIEDGKVVKIFDGVNVKDMDYLEVYNSFYQEKTREAQKIEKLNQDTLQKQQLTNRQKMRNIAGTIVMLAIIFVISLLWHRMLRKRTI